MVLQLYLEINDSSLLLYILLFLSGLALFRRSSRFYLDFIIVALTIYSVLPSAQVLGRVTATKQQKQIQHCIVSHWNPSGAGDERSSPWLLHDSDLAWQLSCGHGLHCVPLFTSLVFDVLQTNQQPTAPASSQIDLIGAELHKDR